MTDSRNVANTLALTRMPTGVPRLDEVLGGGLPVGRSCLVAGPPGTGKTTLGNQIAFNHAHTGGNVVFATLLAESHDVMLQNLRGFRFFDPRLVGDRIRYLNLLADFEEGGLDRVLTTIRREVRDNGVNLLVVDGVAIIDDVAISPLDVRQFAQGLDALAGLLGCTTILLSDPGADEARRLGAQVNGMILLAAQHDDNRAVRMLEVVKLRGSAHATGRHVFAIGTAGVTVYPRLEALAGLGRPAQGHDAKLGTGVEVLDEMLAGGLRSLSNTMVIGTPGAGKTLLGLSFITAGAARGEPGLILSFHETPGDIVSTAASIGLDLGRYVEDGIVRILWEPPLEVPADAWAWRTLEAVEAHGARRLFIDAMTDVQRLITSPQRVPTYFAALTNELRALGATVMFAAEIDAYASDQLAVPVSPASAAMDNAILLRHVELHSELRRLISVLKGRQLHTDGSIREFTIGDRGIVVGDSFRVSSGLLSGRVEAFEPREPSGRS